MKRVNVDQGAISFPILQNSRAVKPNEALFVFKPKAERKRPMEGALPPAKKTPDVKKA